MEGAKMDLRPPIRRSWLRRRLGKIYYAAKRYALWCHPKFKWAKGQEKEDLPALHFTHKTPLRRNLRGEEQIWQENKVVNLRLAAEKVDGIVIHPGETFSYWRLIGKPSRRKGYKEGMVLFLGQIGGDIGGGLCQLSNLIFWMALHSPLTVVERYRHSHDVFPDSSRSQPFGSGATCAYPHRDLMLRNDTHQPFQLRIRVGDTHLHGQLRAMEAPTYRYTIFEKDACIRQMPWGGYVRHNELWRRTEWDGGEREEKLVTNDAIMMYSPLLPE